MWIAALLAVVMHQESNAGTRVIRGSVVVVDAGDRRFEHASGTLIIYGGFPSGSEWMVPFRDGTFAFLLDARATWIDVFSAWTTLGPARIDDIQVEIPEGAHLDLRADLDEPSTLRVCDAETAAPLDCVELLPPNFLRGARANLRAIDGAAIEIAPFRGEDGWGGRRGDGHWTVRAPGFVEGRLTLTSDSPRSNVVYLERAGRLEIVLENSPSTMHTYVEVESLDDGLVFRACGDLGSRRHLEGLKPGPYVARVVHEFLDYRRVVLAETRVEVRPDRVVTAKLVASKPPDDDTDSPGWRNDE